MTYTQGGLRDREFSKFATQASYPGSVTLVAVNNQVKRYEFSAADLLANAAGSIDVYSTEGLNGMLQGVAIEESNWSNANGSLFINASGIETTMWSMVSGTGKGMGVATSGLTLPRATTIYTWSSPISGTNDAEFAEIPLADTVLHLVGSSLGNAASGLGLKVIYR